MKIIRTVFQQDGRFVLVVDMEEQSGLSTLDIAGLEQKMTAALPGIFPGTSDPLTHFCGGQGTAIPEHTLREEVRRGTSIPHLLEHILLHLLSRRSLCCSAFCGQRSQDLASGLTTHYYLVLDCPSQIEAVVAVEIAFGLVSAWVEGRTVSVDPNALLRRIEGLIQPMVSSRTTQV